MVLHITNDYAGSSVYKNLVLALDNMGIGQIVYTAVKDRKSIGKNKVSFKTPDSKIIYSNILNKSSDRIFYKRKIKKITKDIQNKIDLRSIKFIHAHTWYSDGGVALKLFNEWKIPYMVAIRSTDVDVFYKYLVCLRRKGLNILINSKHIVSISVAYHERLLNLSFQNNMRDEISVKSSLIPNGINPFWLTNVVEGRRSGLIENKFEILYVGTFIKRKRIVALQKAVILANQSTNISITLHIVGGGGASTQQVLKICEKHPAQFKFYGRVADNNQLLSIYRKCHIFAMPSIRETFGLVYVEAMTQGLPILYTENDGIDGYYPFNVGQKVRRNASAVEIKDTILEMIRDFKTYIIPTELIQVQHDWTQIASKYDEFYKKYNIDIMM